MHYKCFDCGSEYKITYNEEDVEDSPQYCPFCCAYIIKDEVDNSEDYYVREDEERIISFEEEDEY